MAHPYQEHRASSASSKRVGRILGHAKGGSAHPDEAEDRKLFKKMLAEHEKKETGVHGKKAGGRLDKYARGGVAKKRSRKDGNTVNIAIVTPDSRKTPPGEEGVMPGGPSIPMPPAPPVGGGMGPPGLPPGLPPKLPMGGPMKRGGRVKMRGGSETGVGRLDKIKAYGRRAKSK